MEEPSRINEFQFQLDKTKQDALRQLLEAAASGKDTEEPLKLVKQKLTEGADTDGNHEAMDLLKFVQADNPKSMGLSVGDPPVLLSDILWTIEGMEMPSEVQADFPHLKEHDWNAALRVMMLILSTYDLSCIEDDS
ncbi:hypothetical protein [Bremerella sp. P1]|uniref:hypothetical protein n=1 Tax=Bremerella sp. P1 TaxID=3026424 RepID=UPI002368E747|nr:hypothetical protein [Bremerella sp. P1]WDI44229.1 hypothetical protein PSR63_09825 [Bremerella sp. P1]